MIKGILFDMDGVLIDSERFYFESFTEATKRMGHVLPKEVFVQCMGNGIPYVRKYYEEQIGNGFSFDKMRVISYAIITGEQIKNGKPHPEIYLTGAKALGLSAKECIAVEDSAAGIQSAKVAGCYVVHIPDFISPKKEEQEVADVIIPSMDEMIQVIEKIRN